MDIHEPWIEFTLFRSKCFHVYVRAETEIRMCGGRNTDGCNMLTNWSFPPFSLLRVCVWTFSPFCLSQRLLAAYQPNLYSAWFWAPVFDICSYLDWPVCFGVHHSRKVQHSLWGQSISGTMEDWVLVVMDLLHLYSTKCPKHITSFANNPSNPVILSSCKEWGSEAESDLSKGA